MDRFLALKVPRQRVKTRGSGEKLPCPLSEVLLLAMCTALAGADEVTWGPRAWTFLRRFCPHRDGIPSHDTLGDVLAP